jgi:hypothetical protein
MSGTFVMYMGEERRGEERRSAYRGLVERLMDRDHFEELGLVGSTILK